MAVDGAKGVERELVCGTGDLSCPFAWLSLCSEVGECCTAVLLLLLSPASVFLNCGVLSLFVRFVDIFSVKSAPYCK